MVSTALGGYGAQTLATATGLATNPDGITTAVRVSYAAGASNAGAMVSALPDDSTQYTLSAWVWNEGATSETIALALKGASSGGSQLVPQAVWTKLTWTFTTPAGLVLGNEFGVRISVTSAAGSFLVTGIMLEKAPLSLGDFYDGNSGAIGDFTHDWLGTANNSTSRRKGVNVTGATGTAVQSIPYQSADRPAYGGTKFARYFFTTSGAIGINLTDTVIPADAPRAVGMWVRASASVTVQPRLRTLAGLFTNVGSSVVLPVNVWTLIKAQGVWGVGADASFGMVVTNSTGQQYGGTLDVDTHWCYELSNVDADYIDGNQPFSRWEGTAHASASLGYPPQLQDIAGKPSVDLVGVSNTGGVAIPVAPFGARTIYVVYETTGFTANYNTCMYYGISASKGFILQTAAAGSLNLANRFDFPGGSANGAIVMGNGRLNRKSVAAFAFSEGLTGHKSCLNGGNEIIGSMNPGTTGWDDGRVQAMNGGTEIKPIRVLVYYADHDRATRIEISKYLGNKYGANIA